MANKGTAFTRTDAERILAATEKVEMTRGGDVRDSQVYDGAEDFNHPIPFRNASGETVPPFAVMLVSGSEQVGGVGGLARAIIDKPGESARAKRQTYLVNSDVGISDGELGQAQGGEVFTVRSTASPFSPGYPCGPYINDDDANAGWCVDDKGGGFEMLASIGTAPDGQNALMRVRRMRSNMIFAVDLELDQTTDDRDGSDGEEPDFRYHVRARNEEHIIYASIALNNNQHPYRRSKGLHEPATAGLASWDNDGFLIMHHTNEVIVRKFC